MADEIIGSFTRPNNDKDIVQVAESEFKGKQYFSFRVWWKDADDGGKLKPSRNGINLTFEEREAFAQLAAKAFPQYLTFKGQPIAAGGRPD